MLKSTEVHKKSKLYDHPRMVNFFEVIFITVQRFYDWLSTKAKMYAFCVSIATHS